MHHAWADVFGQQHDTAVVVAGRIPADLGCTFTLSPVGHQAFGRSGMTLRTAGVNHGLVQRIYVGKGHNAAVGVAALGGLHRYVLAEERQRDSV